MNCEDVRDLIQEALDGTALPEEAGRHIDACHRCASYRAGLAEVDDLLVADPVLAWTPELTAGVVAEVRKERRNRFALGLAAAAVVLLAGWLSIGLLPEVPGLAGVGDRVAAGVAARVDVPGSPGEAAARISDGVAGLLETFYGTLSSATFAAGVPVALAAVFLLFLLNVIAAGRVRLAGRRS